MKISAIVILASWPRLAVKLFGGIRSSKWIDIHSPGEAVSMTEIVVPDITGVNCETVNSWLALLGAPHPFRKINKLWLHWPASSLDNKILRDGKIYHFLFLFALRNDTLIPFRFPLSIFPVLMGTNALSFLSIKWGRKWSYNPKLAWSPST